MRQRPQVFILITGYCTFFTVITTILEVRAPIAAPVKSFKVRVCHVKVFKNSVVEHIGFHYLVSDDRNRFLQSNSVCRKRSKKNALQRLINFKPSSAFLFTAEHLKFFCLDRYVPIRNGVYAYITRQSVLIHGSDYAFRIFFSIPHHIHFFMLLLLKPTNHFFSLFR